VLAPHGEHAARVPAADVHDVEVREICPQVGGRPAEEPQHAELDAEPAVRLVKARDVARIVAARGRHEADARPSTARRLEYVAFEPHVAVG